jgi:hypothetical protein
MTRAARFRAALSYVDETSWRQRFRNYSRSIAMTLVQIAIVLVVIGVVMWLINTYIPMMGAIKSLLNLVVIVVVVIWLLQIFGIIGPIPGVQIPRMM